MRVYKPALLKDALYNLMDNSGASDDYCKGLVVGMVSVIMAITGGSHKNAMQILTRYLSAAEHYRTIPKDWWK